MLINDKDIILSEKSKELISLDSRLQAIDRFNVYDFGRVTSSEKQNNLESLNLRNGSVYGVYMTPDGDVFIIVHVFALNYTFIYTSHEEPFYNARYI